MFKTILIDSNDENPAIFENDFSLVVTRKVTVAKSERLLFPILVIAIIGQLFSFNIRAVFTILEDSPE